ncbi:hypothetical protein MegaChil _gp0835 [Megavirus chiliensis]|uniref:Uncharacterized protein mg835 n=1 Tax=Megavirus chiliensis TaxID=1094892 RepID=G5CRT9_9VIRU|nr:hypothetical protein MegaChil _gp0835 [Megavirus chiliensis]
MHNSFNFAQNAIVYDSRLRAIPDIMIAIFAIVLFIFLSAIIFNNFI